MQEATGIKESNFHTNNIADNWYENFFEGVNCEMWERAATMGTTLSEVDFLLDIFNLSSSPHLLDLPCGNGRHSIALAKHGFQMTAFDISGTFIRSLQQKLEGQPLPVSVLQNGSSTQAL